MPLLLVVLAATHLEVFAGGGWLSAPGAHGANLNAGIHVPVGERIAFGFDLGYGLVDSAVSAQDRWWLMPSAAWVLPFESTRVELGAGLGLGASSGYDSWAAYHAAPFGPTWAFQLVPAARAHLVVSRPVTPRFAAFVRLEVASLLLGGNSVGFRDNNPRPTVTDTTWVNLSIGGQLRVQ